MVHAPKTPVWLSPELLAVVGFVAVSECVAAALLGGAADLPHPGRAGVGAVVATALASALVARRATRDGSARAFDVSALVGSASVGAGLWGLAYALGGEGPVAGVALGATIGLPASLAVGVVLALLGRTLRSVRMFAANDALERVGLVAGGAAGLAGAIAMGLAAPRYLPVPAVSAALGLAVLALTYRRDARRVAWLRDVYAGKVAGYSVAPLDASHTRMAEIAPLVPGSTVDAVLLEDAAHGLGPYRAEGRPRPIALLQHDAAPSVWPIRARAQRAGLVFAMTVALGAAASIAQVHRARAESAKETALATPPPRMTCLEARAAFEYRARDAGEVARALLLTHAQQAQVPEGEGWLYLSDAHGALPPPDVVERVLSAEKQLACIGVPQLRAMAPLRRGFSVEVRLAEGAAEMAPWVRAALTEAFQPGDASAHESVQFGFYDRRVRWRVVATVVQTGARAREILIDGTRGDLTLAPAELAALDEIVIVDAATGERL